MLEELFRRVNQENLTEKFEITMSYLEIYNENIKDLLSGKGDALEIRDDGAKGIVVAGITSVTTRSPYEVIPFLITLNRS